MLNTANINTNTTARTGTARIDREAIANNLPTLAEVLARPVEYIVSPHKFYIIINFIV